jgi:hypothetical protein
MRVCSRAGSVFGGVSGMTDFGGGAGGDEVRESGWDDGFARSGGGALGMCASPPAGVW